MIDAHCHLQHLMQRMPLDQIKQRALQVGVTQAISCSCSVTDWDSQITNDGFILPQFGIHPWWAAEERPSDWIDQLRLRLLRYPSAGVGEIGLDKNKAKRGVPFPVQVDTFTAQLRVAKDLDRPASIHCVNAYGTLVDILKEHQMTSPLIIHSFSGNGDHIRDLQRVGYVFFSVSGQCPRAEVIPLIPSDRLLLETDSPDQPLGDGEGAPAKIDEKTNDCSQLILVAKRVADATGRPLTDVIAAATANTIRAFRLGSV